MPSIVDPLRVGKDLDRRRKLTDDEREEIALNPRGLSQRALAREYGVSRRLITFILDPKKHEENKQRRQERGGSKAYYDVDKHRESMQGHRKYKRKLLDEGKL